MAIRVLMTPDLQDFGNEESGIRRVVEAYRQHARRTGVHYVKGMIDDEDTYDLLVVHAGSTNRYPTNKPIVAMLHGLYWTADYNAAAWEWRVNEYVVESIRIATLVTVPSRWVAKTIQRDARIDPIIVPHGIDLSLWKNNEKNHGYVLWNKNRDADVCSPYPVGQLARRARDIKFLTTFSPGDELINVEVIGLQPHATMKTTIQRAAIYLSTTKETFGIGTLEAMASGVPVLGFDWGGNRDIVQHGVTGYLARPGNYTDLANGLRYCLEHRDVLSANSLNVAVSIQCGLSRVSRYGRKLWIFLKTL